MPVPEITVLYFAAASTATGLASERVPLPGPLPSSSTPSEITTTPSTPEPGLTLTSLATLLVARHPNTTLAQVLEGSQWSVDAEMIEDPSKVVLRGGEEVAVICPVSGG